MSSQPFPSSSAPTHQPPTTNWRLKSQADFGLLTLRQSSGLTAELLPSGALFALRHGTTLINQFLPGPVENGLFRLLLRWRGADSPARPWAPLVGPGLDFFSPGADAAEWASLPGRGLRATTQFRLHPTLTAWSWHIRVDNDSAQTLTLDVLHLQDLGLADEAAVRNNEAYTSQYIDLLPHLDSTLGWILLARQNQAMAQRRYPWLGLACRTGGRAYCTDGSQFFGTDHRLTGIPRAVSTDTLPSQRLQYEFGAAGLQSETQTIAPGEAAEFTFVARYVADHPHASSADDLPLLQAALAGDWYRSAAINRHADASVSNQGTLAATASSLFLTAPWQHGETPTIGDWDAWFHGVRRHEEFGPDDSLRSFFYDAHTHVVSREKEATLARSHGHILRSGDSQWFDADHFGLTCYAAGIFGAQAYLGHPSFARLLSVVRNPLNVTRASGQRVFVRVEGEWHQLGVPSAFIMTPSDVRWIYRLGADLIEARVWCANQQAASLLELRVLVGDPREFLISHELILGATEFEHGGRIEAHASEGWMMAEPDRASLVGKHQPALCFALAALDPATVAEMGGDNLLHADGKNRQGPYVAFHTHPVARCGVILLGSTQGPASLAAAVRAARQRWARNEHAAVPPASPIALQRPDDEAVARVHEILPWFTHNASIHFSAPHGLEQYGGAAWGVRDVCQGSVEWLLASGQFAVVRKILLTVFAQQYPHDGSWPQWFMFPPYRFIQQAHSHGDVCFWPLKALADYVEASHDLEFLHTPVEYTDAERFESVGPAESLLAHCDRVISQCEARFMPGTALVNYGDGDWDDTLQPADPAMRTRMVSTWTVGLAFHCFRQLAQAYDHARETARAGRLRALCADMRRDFAARAMPDGIVAGFLIADPDGSMRPLLHPSDAVTRIRYRLLPMTRSILAELFTPEEATRHLAIIESELRFPDGVRLMSEPSTYHGGLERLFKRAETAANVGREIGLQYVHAHLRYAEALAKVGSGDALWTALQVVNPVALEAVVPNAAPRQSNVYFSSSDADFDDRYVAAQRWDDLRTGRVSVRGGWRLYSSGPGLFLHKIRACLLGVRECFDDIVFDPVLPRALDGLVTQLTLCGRLVELRYHVRDRNFSPRSIAANGSPLSTARRESNPYREGGVCVARSLLESHLKAERNVITIEL